ncbi:lysosomal alpha-glucosidase-like [Ixodes scapularis]
MLKIQANQELQTLIEPSALLPTPEGDCQLQSGNVRGLCHLSHNRHLHLQRSREEDPGSPLNVVATVLAKGVCFDAVYEYDALPHYLTGSLEGRLEMARMDLVIAGDTAQCQVGKLSERFDCYPEPGSNEAGCLSRGCCWGRLDEIPGERKLDIPYCYFPINYAGYYVENAEISDDRIDVMLVRRTPSGIDVDVPFVHVEILFYDQDTLRIRVLDPFHRRFIPPVPMIPFRTFSGDRQYVVGLCKSSGKLDTQWNDIDYMVRQNDFTYDDERFNGLPDFVNDLHAGCRHYVVIVDPAVSGSEPPGTYPPYDQGMEMDIFVKNMSGGVVYAKVWNDKSSVFPDFTHPKAEEYWAQQFKNFHNVVPFDGAWIDMNEPSNFYNGHADGCPTADRLDHPPYVPGGEPLYTRTLCMSDRHHIAPHYFVHNIYSHFEAKATYKALASIRRKRPFIISRVTSPGQAAWSGHWSGDIASSWEDMRLSIPNMLSFGMYGMPLVGADICGFNSNTTVELCARWQALGAFYPFSRNHNTDDGLDQDPYSMGPLVVDAARSTLLGRYTLLPYLYTLFYRSHTIGETVARPLFFEFPEDPNTYSIDEQFLWGPSLMFSPALYPVSA